MEPQIAMTAPMSPNPVAKLIVLRNSTNATIHIAFLRLIFAIEMMIAAMALMKASIMLVEDHHSDAPINIGNIRE